ncbi:MAG TPA: hypothetical protein VGL69_25450 [Solirubrobacteraceae bacterium]|jgi:hypothetical protein
MTPLMSDDDLYDAMRTADPLAGEPIRPAEETEASLTRLLAHGPDPVLRPRRPRRTRRWWLVRAAPIGIGAGAAAVLAAALPAHGPARVGQAHAQTIIRRAADALTGAHGAILEADVSTTQTWSNGTSKSWSEQDWQELARPYDGRTIDTGVWPQPVEMATVHGDQWLYDASTNTIYTNEPTPAFTLSAGPTPHTFTLHVGTQTLTVSAAQAAKLRSGADVWASDQNQSLIVIPRITTGPQTLSWFRHAAIHLLHAPGSTVTDGLTVDGQHAIQISSADGQTVYDVAPSTYAPIQMTQPNPTLPGNTPSTTMSTVSGWQKLPGTPANLGLLSLTAQHPNATVDTSAADYTAAENRLFP